MSNVCVQLAIGLLPEADVVRTRVMQEGVRGSLTSENPTSPCLSEAKTFV